MARVAYDGTNYHGFQIQPNGDTVQERIEKSLDIIYRQRVRINCSGRTDTGVHALSQYVDFMPPVDNIPVENLQRALNSLLPKDIKVVKLSAVDSDFHSRYSALYRDYTYLIYNSEVASPFLCRYVWHIPHRIDIESMKRIKSVFEGVRDFELMANEPNGKNCVRHVHFLRIKRFKNFVIIHIRANGFLRGMVRNIVGNLVAFSRNTLKMGMSDNIIDTKAAIKSRKAPPNGLFLTKVGYKRGVVW